MKKEMDLSMERARSGRIIGWTLNWSTSFFIGRGTRGGNTRSVGFALGLGIQLQQLDAQDTSRAYKSVIW